MRGPLFPERKGDLAETLQRLFLVLLGNVAPVRLKLSLFDLVHDHGKPTG
jgi:hypothetical protein